MPIVVRIGSTIGQRVDKFKKFGLTLVDSLKVGAPRIDECFAQLECKVIDTQLVTKYNLFILKVVRAWIESSKERPRTIHHCGHGKFVIDGETIKLPFRKK